MTVLAFVLECAAVAALVAAAASGLSLVFAAALAASRPSAARGADLALLFGLMPAVATLAVVAATVWPPLTSALGVGAADDCFSHSHHGHLCLIHLGAPEPALMVLGSVALAVLFFRATALGARWIRGSSDVRMLERLGTVQPAEFPIVWLPGAPPLCLAAGVLRRRILVSSVLEAALGRQALAAAIAHECAHLRRSDPLTASLLQLASLATVPGAAGWLARIHEEFTERACDEEAARTTGDPALVAEALMQVAALAGQPGPALAFGRGALERRVRALLCFSPASPRALRFPLLVACSTGVLAALAAALTHAPAVHHAVETVLHDLL